jgi:hypothetical protein
VNELRAEAKRVCGGIKDEKERARALFDFLKSNLLVNYSVVDGIPAENALSKKYYLCLTGTLYYTLIGRKDLDLNVAGCLVPGHAYPVLQHSQLGPIEIETTASGNKNSVEYGFDYGRRRTMEARKRYDKAHEVGAQKGGLLFTSDKKGAVSNLDLVQSQYRNVVLNLPVLLFLRNPEYRNLAKANLTEIAALKVRDKNGLEVKFLDLVKQLREQFETEQNENPDYKWTGDDLDNFLDTLALIPCPAVDLINRKLVLEMAVKNESFRRDLVKTYEKMLALMEIALQLDPFDRDYRELYLQTLYFADGVEVGSILKKHRERFDEIQKLRFLVDPLTDSSRASATPRSMKLTQVGSDVDISNPQAINDRIKSLAKQDFEDAQARMPYLIAALDRDAKASEKYPQFDEIKHIFFRTANICSEYLKSLDEMAKYVPDIERPNSSALTIQLERIKSRYASKRASN